MFTWDFPYPSQRMPVLAKNVVATSQPLAAQAGLSMLARGGNAVDAGLAAAIALTVVELTSNGIGSDAFAILRDGQRLVGLNPVAVTVRLSRASAAVTSAWRMVWRGGVYNIKTLSTTADRSIIDILAEADQTNGG